MRNRIIILIVMIVVLLGCLCACNDGGSPSEHGSTLGYSITYELNGGVVDGNPTSYDENDEFLLHHPVKEGYTFVGWTYEGATDPQLSVRIELGSSGDRHFVANYIEGGYDPLKIAVFADVQLTTDSQDDTANDFLALKNHLSYAKSIDANVIFMNGDVVNNAVEAYYKYYQRALADVYGEDESVYPEFVMNMGNHEWWDRNERDTAESVALFKKYARIESKYLQKTSAVPYYLDKTETIPSYYKVIEGVPFLVISGYNSNGVINNALKKEISSWLEEINELQSVKEGGPIFVAYHCPISGVTYNGEQSRDVSLVVDELLKGYPNVILFTGDTHFNAVNERTINQVDYTSINIGTSSYSRSVSASATGYAFSNVEISGRMKGDVNYKHQYTPTLMVISMGDNVTKIDRFFTADNVDDVKSIGLTWEIPSIKSKDDFTYTNDRIGNPEWAKKLYGKDGLNWAHDESVRFNVIGNKMLISFRDVEDFKFAEFYRVKAKNMTAGGVKYFNLMSHYYRCEDNPKEYHFVVSNNFISEDNEYQLTVTAYDFFDNPSTNVLRADGADDTLVFPDEIDACNLDNYSNVTRILNYDDKIEGSNSSLECYFRGTKRFSYGILLARVIGDGISESAKEGFSITDKSKGKLTLSLKNLNDYDVTIGLTLYAKVDGAIKCITDGGAESRVNVSANCDWTQITYDFVSTFGISADAITEISLKLFVPNEAYDNVFEMKLLIDGIDIND